MGTDIEKIIREQRNELDIENPPDMLWEGIERNLSLKKPKQNFTWIWRAAAIGFLLVSSALLVLYINEKSVNDQLTSLGDISQEYDSLEKTYKRDIDQIQSSLEIKTVHREELSWLFDELEFLEEMNKTYKEELANYGGKEKVVSTLIDYYEKKLKILKRIELEIQRKNNEDKSEINI